jgi:hypothetical protein
MDGPAYPRTIHLKPFVTIFSAHEANEVGQLRDILLIVTPASIYRSANKDLILASYKDPLPLERRVRLERRSRLERCYRFKRSLPPLYEFRGDVTT